MIHLSDVLGSHPPRAQRERLKITFLTQLPNQKPAMVHPAPRHQPSALGDRSPDTPWVDLPSAQMLPSPECVSPTALPPQNSTHPSKSHQIPSLLFNITTVQMLQEREKC